VVHDCELIQDGCEALSLSPSVSDMALGISDVQHDIIKKSYQVKFSDHNTLAVLSQVQKFFQNAITTSCQIDFFNPITSDVFALDIEDLCDNGNDVINGIHDDMICTNMVVVGRGAKQGADCTIGLVMAPICTNSLPTLQLQSGSLKIAPPMAFIHGALHASSQPSNINAYWAELHGLHAILLATKAICTFHKITFGSITLGYDNFWGILLQAIQHREPTPCSTVHQCHLPCSELSLWYHSTFPACKGTPRQFFPLLHSTPPCPVEYPCGHPRQMCSLKSPPAVSPSTGNLSA